MELDQSYLDELRQVFGQGRPNARHIKDMLALVDVEWPEDKPIIQIGQSFSDFKSLKVTKNRFRFKGRHISIFPGRLADGERILATTSGLCRGQVWFFYHKKGRGIRLLTAGNLLGVAPYGPYDGF